MRRIEKKVLRRDNVERMFRESAGQPTQTTSNEDNMITKLPKNRSCKPSAAARKRNAEAAAARAAKIRAIEDKFRADKAAIIAANPGGDNSSSIKRLEWAADEALRAFGTHLFDDRRPQQSYDAYNSDAAWGN